jgi:gas vesicle protein
LKDWDAHSIVSWVISSFFQFGLMLDIEKLHSFIKLKINFMSTGKIITGLAAGLAAGAVLGILFAPDKGVETRKKIAQKGSDLKDSIKSRFSSLVDEVADEYDNAANKVKDMADQGKDKVTSLKADAKHSMS